MLYLDYAKKTENGYILNFFADSVDDRDLCPQGSEGSFLLLAQTFGHHHISDMENNDVGYIISIHSFDQGSIKCVKYDGTIERFLIEMDDACTVSDAVYRMDRYSIN